MQANETYSFIEFGPDVQVEFSDEQKTVLRVKTRRLTELERSTLEELFPVQHGQVFQMLSAEALLAARLTNILR